MNHDIYIFGSAVRGEVDHTSDIDVLVVPFGEGQSAYPQGWSVYSPNVIQEYYSLGRLFAWHLHFESKCISSIEKTPFLEALGKPSPYVDAIKDISELEQLFQESITEIRKGTNSLMFELGIAYTSIRDIAMSASWGMLDRPCFSRNAPYLLPVACPISAETYKMAMRARLNSTRGLDIDIDEERASQELLNAPVTKWIRTLRNSL